MKAVFVELPPFERYRADYLADDAFRALQDLLMQQRKALKAMIKAELEARRK